MVFPTFWLLVLLLRRLILRILSFFSGCFWGYFGFGVLLWYVKEWIYFHLSCLIWIWVCNMSNQFWELTSLVFLRCCLSLVSFLSWSPVRWCSTAEVLCLDHLCPLGPFGPVLTLSIVALGGTASAPGILWVEAMGPAGQRAVPTASSSACSALGQSLSVCLQSL